MDAHEIYNDGVVRYQKELRKSGGVSDFKAVTVHNVKYQITTTQMNFSEIK